MFNFWNKRNGDSLNESPFAKGGQEGDLTKDTESKSLWKELAEAEEKWCCKAIREVTKNSGPLYISISMADKGAVTIIFKHCPSCGRKLEQN